MSNRTKRALVLVLSGVVILGCIPTSTPDVAPTVASSPEPTDIPVPTPTQTPEPLFFGPRFYLTYRGGWEEKDLVVEVERFPSGMYEIHAQVKYENVPEMEEIGLTWYRDGNLAVDPMTVLSEGSGFVHTQVRNSVGLLDGTYDLRVSYGGDVVLHGEIEMGWAPTIWPLAFTDDDVNQWASVGLPDQRKTRFPGGVSLVAYVAEVAHLSTGASMVIEWYVDGELWHRNTSTWDEDSDSGWITGRAFNTDGAPLPSGNWEVRIFLEGELARIGIFAIDAVSEG